MLSNMSMADSKGRANLLHREPRSLPSSALPRLPRFPTSSFSAVVSVTPVLARIVSAGKWMSYGSRTAHSGPREIVELMRFNRPPGYELASAKK